MENDLCDEKRIPCCCIRIGTSYYETKINDVDTIVDLCNKDQMIELKSKNRDYVRGRLVEKVEIL